MNLSKFLKKNITTSATWRRHLPQILNAIKQSEFVSVDLEFSGLHIKNDRFVGVEQSYQSHCEGARSFQPLQLGICAARRDDISGRNWVLTPASIYIYPKNEKVFQVSSSTLTFLKQNNFDFNEWISSGIGYLTPNEEEERKRSIYSRLELAQRELQNSNEGEQVTKPTYMAKELFNHISPEDTEFLREIKCVINEWLNGCTPSMEMCVENGFQRLLIHATISLEYKGIYSTTIKKENQRFISLFKSHQQLIEQHIKGLEDELVELDECVGVRKVLEEISKSGKILIGHNCFYDFLHFYQIINGSLPPQLSNFKENWLKHFPINFDTKFISETHELLSPLQPPSTLKGLCDYLFHSEAASKGISFKIDCIEGTHWKDPRVCTDGSHEAGFDSMLTSIVFILQCTYIMKSKNLNWEKFEICTKPSTLSIIDLLPLMVNRIRLVKTQPNVIYLAGNEEVDMSRHFYITGLTPNFTKSDILELISPVWVNIIPEDEHSCWLIVKHDEDVNLLQNLYKNSNTFPYKLYTFQEYQEIQNSANPNQH